MRLNAITAIAAIVMCLNTSVLAAECYHLELKLSGSLTESKDGFEMELPVKSLGSEAVAGLSFEKTAEGVWGISLIRPAPDNFEVAQVAYLNIVDGKQVGNEVFGFQLHSNDPNVARSSVVVSLADFTDVGERGVVVTEIAKIKMLSFEQIRREWWPASEAAERNARRRLSELVEAGLLLRERVTARPLLSLEEPVFRWKPGDAVPEFAPLAWKLQKRWTEPAREVTAYLGTRRAASIFGGRADGRIKNPAQATHDIHLGALYLKFRSTAPKLAAGWIGEEILAPTREQQKLPDAILHDREGKPRLVVEFGGAYPTERVQAFHEDCAARELPYELW